MFSSLIAYSNSQALYDTQSVLLLLYAGIYKGADIKAKLTGGSICELLELDEELDVLLLEDKLELEEIILLELLIEELLELETLLEELELLVEEDELELDELLLEELEVVLVLSSLDVLSLELVLVKDSLDELTLELDELVAGVQEAMISANNVGTILLIFIWGNNILVK